MSFQFYFIFSKIYYIPSTERRSKTDYIHPTRSNTFLIFNLDSSLFLIQACNNSSIIYHLERRISKLCLKYHASSRSNHRWYFFVLIVKQTTFVVHLKAYILTVLSIENKVSVSMSMKRGIFCFRLMFWIYQGCLSVVISTIIVMTRVIVTETRATKSLKTVCTTCARI